MKLQDFYDLVHRLTYQGLPCMSINKRNWRDGGNPVPEGYVYLSIWINSTCVDSGRPTRIESGGLSSIKDIEDTNEDSHISSIKNILIGLQIHEIEETIRLDDKRIFNPHDFSVKVIHEKQHDMDDGVVTETKEAA